MKRKMKMQKDGNFICINNKWYQFEQNDDGDFRTGEHVLVEIDKKKFDRKVIQITEKLFSFVDPKLVMKDALKDLTEPELDRLLSHLKKRKGKVKPKIKKHCIQMKVGGVEIPIR